MSIAIKIQHVDLPSGNVTFSDDEVLSLIPRPVQEVIEQRSQTGSFSAVFAGRDQYDFDLSFRIYRASTLDKLDQIRSLKEIFTFFPFMIVSPLSSYQVIWAASPYREQWVRGRRQADWTFDVVWHESTALSCVVGS